ncbi:hypothetical protein [Erysipelatoclostridium sp. An173]
MTIHTKIFKVGNIIEFDDKIFEELPVQLKKKYENIRKYNLFIVLSSYKNASIVMPIADKKERSTIMINIHGKNRYFKYKTRKYVINSCFKKVFKYNKTDNIELIKKQNIRLYNEHMKIYITQYLKNSIKFKGIRYSDDQRTLTVFNNEGREIIRRINESVIFYVHTYQDLLDIINTKILRYDNVSLSADIPDNIFELPNNITAYPLYFEDKQAITIKIGGSIVLTDDTLIFNNVSVESISLEKLFRQIHPVTEIEKIVKKKNKYGNINIFDDGETVKKIYLLNSQMEYDIVTNGFDIENKFVPISYYDREKDKYNILDIKISYMKERDMYLELKEKFKNTLSLIGVKLDDVTTPLFDSNDKEITNYDPKFKAQSIMGKMGYRTGENGLSIEDRRKIINYLLENEIMSADEIMNHLNFLINYVGASQGKGKSVRDWKADLKFVEQKKK